MTIKILVMKSGEDVIADVKEMMSKDNQVMGYFLHRPCVVTLESREAVDDVGEDGTIELEPEVKSEKTIRMHPWMPLAKESAIPLSTDWVVTMITPVDKVLEMYTKEVLPAYGKETDPTDSPDESVKTGLTD